MITPSNVTILMINDFVGDPEIELIADETEVKQIVAKFNHTNLLSGEDEAKALLVRRSPEGEIVECWYSHSPAPNLGPVLNRMV